MTKRITIFILIFSMTLIFSAEKKSFETWKEEYFNKLQTETENDLEKKLNIKELEELKRSMNDEELRLEYHKETDIFPHNEEYYSFQKITHKKVTIENVLNVVKTLKSGEKSNVLYDALTLLWSSRSLLPDHENVIKTVLLCLKNNKNDYMIAIYAANIMVKYNKKEDAKKLLLDFLNRNDSESEKISIASYFFFKLNDFSFYPFIVKYLNSGKVYGDVCQLMPYHGKIVKKGLKIDAEFLLKQSLANLYKKGDDYDLKDEFIGEYKKIREIHPEFKLKPVKTIIIEAEKIAISDKKINKMEELNSLINKIPYPKRKKEVLNLRLDWWLDGSANDIRKIGNLKEAEKDLLKAYSSENEKEIQKTLTHYLLEKYKDENQIILCINSAAAILARMSEFRKAELLYGLISDKNNQLPYSWEAALDKTYCAIEQDDSNKKLIDNFLILLKEKKDLPPEKKVNIYVRTLWAAHRLKQYSLAEKLFSQGMKEFKNNVKVTNQLKNNQWTIKPIEENDEEEEYNYLFNLK